MLHVPAQVHSKVRVSNVSGVRTKKHQKKADHKQRMAAAAALQDAQDAPAPAVEDAAMEDATKVEKKALAKQVKKSKKSGMMID